MKCLSLGLTERVKQTHGFVVKRIAYRPFRYSCENGLLVIPNGGTEMCVFDRIMETHARFSLKRLMRMKIL